MTSTQTSHAAPPDVIVIGEVRDPAAAALTAFQLGALIDIWSDPSIDRVWKAEHVAAAAAQGWAISGESGIVREPSSRRFESDEQAVSFVSSEATAKVGLSILAVQVHKYVRFRLESLASAKRRGLQEPSADTKELVVRTPQGDFTLEQPAAFNLKEDQS